MTSRSPTLCQSPIDFAAHEKSACVDSALPDCVIEKQLLGYLSDITMNFPIEISAIMTSLTKEVKQEVPYRTVEDLLQKFAAQRLIR